MRIFNRDGNLIHPAHFQPPGQRPSAEAMIAELGLQRSPFSITISRLEYLKKPDDVLQVIAEVRKRGLLLKGIMIGDGRMADELKRLSIELGIQDGIVFAGNRSQEWIASILPHALVVIGPSMGRALTEAALACVPIVVYDSDWHSELIQTGKTGELVTYGDWSAMTDSVVKFLNDPAYAKLMGQNVRKAAMEMMDPVKLNEHERSEYDKILNKNGS